MSKKKFERITELVRRYPELVICESSIKEAERILSDTIKNDKTIYTCGNGGSYSDSLHIVGELLKGFVKQRPLDTVEKDMLKEKFGEDGAFMAQNLQKGIRCAALGTQLAFHSAYSNDVESCLVLAQELYTVGNEGDTLICLSTSGNSENIYYAALTAKIMGMKVILFTGSRAGKITNYADYTIAVPSTETFKIQELHLPVYHALCLDLEEEFFDE